MILIAIFFPALLAVAIHHSAGKDKDAYKLLYLFAVYCILTNLLTCMLLIFSSPDAAFTTEQFTIAFAARYILLSAIFSVLLGIAAVAYKKGAIAFRVMPDIRSRGRRRIIPVVLLLLGETLYFAALMIIFTNSYLVRNWDTLNAVEILFHLSVPLRGVSREAALIFVRECILPVMLIMLLSNCLLFIKPKNSITMFIKLRKNKLACTLFPWRYPRALLLALGIMLFAWGLIITGSNFDYRAVITQLTEPSAFIEENYVEPRTADITFPGQKRNLIYIYVESLETALLSEELGGAQPKNLIPEIAALMDEHISFSHTGQLSGAYVLTSVWTIASLVSQTAGIPLISLIGNAEGRDGKLLPNAYSLGQILENNGYTNTFILGSDAAFAGRDIYFRTHGNYRLLDWNYARKNGIIPVDYWAWWGFEDKILYAWAKEEALRLAQAEAPFNLTLLTADMHHISGYVCDLCKDEYEDQYANVVACASRQLYDFVSWAKQQDFFADTTIVIAGDHASMDPNFFQDLDSNYKRNVPVIFINSVAAPLNTSNRKFSLYDMFPTTLAALGADIKGNRLGLGVDLFSAEPTLVERFSEDTAISELKKLSRFYNEAFW